MRALETGSTHAGNVLAQIRTVLVLYKSLLLYFGGNIDQDSRSNRPACTPRETIFILIPKTKSASGFNRLMKTSYCKPAQVAACAGNGLVSMHDSRTRTYHPEHRFIGRFSDESCVPVKSFLKEFYSGFSFSNTEMRKLDQFTTRDATNKNHVANLFRKGFSLLRKRTWVMATLWRHSKMIADTTTGSGLEWEFTARVGLTIIVWCTGFRPLSSIERSQMIRGNLWTDTSRCFLHGSKLQQKPNHIAMASTIHRWPSRHLGIPSERAVHHFDTTVCVKIYLRTRQQFHWSSNEAV